MISFCAVLAASAQEEIVSDSLRIRMQESETRLLFLSSPAISDELAFPLSSELKIPIVFNQPLLPDYTKYLDFKKYQQAATGRHQTFAVNGFGLNYFYPGFAVFNQASYKLNDRLSLGGNSFGASSVFDQFRMNQSIQNMSTRGASVFLQYKVSDKFKVETRFCITNHPSPWEP